MSTLIEPTTSSATESFYVDSRGATLSADALSGSEACTVEYSGNDGDTWTDLFDGGEEVTLSATQPQIILQGTGMYQVSKPATASSCGVYVSR